MVLPALLTFLPLYINRLDAKNFSRRPWTGPATCFPLPTRAATFVSSITTTLLTERPCITWDGVTDQRERRGYSTGFIRPPRTRYGWTGPKRQLGPSWRVAGRK